jgi:hypothetical protein
MNTKPATTKPTSAQLMKAHRQETKQLLSRIGELAQDIDPQSKSRRLGKDTLRHAVNVLESLQQKTDIKQADIKKPVVVNKRPIPKMGAPKNVAVKR